MPKNMIDVDHVSIRFNLASEKVNNLKEYVIKMAKHELMFQEFMALDDINLHVKKGESWGLIGMNGSGKSTLLKTITGILKPYEGRVRVRGNIAPMIELGAGFDMELTARENIFLNGAVLGHSREFMEEHFEDIVDFAGIRNFLDSPIKNYSSGMKARLGFAVATMVNPEILIVDEVLSVGDYQFRKKCGERMEEMLSGGTTLLYVSHNIDSVKHLCDHALWLDHGHVIMSGPSNEVCDAYNTRQEQLFKLEKKEQEDKKLSRKKYKYDYLIVGAGLFGAVFAAEASKAGKRCLVIERRGHIGGNIYTEQTEGINVHKYGAHIFHTDKPAIWKYIQNYATFNNYINAPVAVYKNELYNLPFNMNTFSKMWGISRPEEAKAIIAGQIAALNITEPKNLEEQALSMVGTDVYEKLVKGYTQKQWGRECKDLPAFIIKRLPLRFTYNNNYFNDPWQGIPEGGYTHIIEQMLEGVEVRLDTDYKEFIKENAGLAARTVYTGPIDEFYDYRFGHLAWRSLRFETEVLDRENYQGNAVVNYTEADIPYTRIIEHKHFEFGEQPKTVISREYPAEWEPGEEPYYPVNDEENSVLYKKYRDLAEKETNVIFGGRLGSYRYYDMDDTIEEALLTAQKELNRRLIDDGQDADSSAEDG